MPLYVPVINDGLCLSVGEYVSKSRSESQVLECIVIGNGSITVHSSVCVESIVVVDICRSEKIHIAIKCIVVVYYTGDQRSCKIKVVVSVTAAVECVVIINNPGDEWSGKVQFVICEITAIECGRPAG